MPRHPSPELTRRRLLQVLGASSGAATLLRPLVAEAEGIVPQRFLYVHYPGGTVSGLAGEGQGAKWFWFPAAGSGPNYTASPLLNLFSAVRASVLPMGNVDLGDPDKMVEGDKSCQGVLFMGTGFMPVIVDGMPSHPDTLSITVPKGTKTIDQLLLERVPALRAPLMPGGTPPQFPSIQLCGTARSMVGQGFACQRVISYAGNNQPLFGEGRSQVAFANIFGSAMMPGTDPATFARRAAQDKSVLDSVIGDIQRMQSLVPVAQRPKLDAQLTAIRSLEARISSMPPPGMIVPPTLKTEPTTGQNGATADEARHQTLIANMLEIIRCAFLSDLTRVASMSFAPVINPLRPITFCPNPGFTFSGDGGSLASSAYNTDVAEAKGEVAAFYLQSLADMLKNMSNTPEGPGSLLDNTFGACFTEFREGSTIERRRNPLLLFGGKFLRLNAGQYLVQSPSVYVNDVWASALTAWGQPTTVFGDPQYGKGAISGLFG
jgi:hypothetical protein